MVRIFGFFIPSRLLVQALLDVLLLIGLIEVSEHLLRLIAGGQSSLWLTNGWPLLLAPLCVICIWAMGFYRQDVRLSYGSGIVAATSAATLAVTLGGTIIISLRAALSINDATSFRWSAVATALCVFGLCLVRSRLIWVTRSSFFKRQILLIGSGLRAAEVETLANGVNSSIVIKRWIRPDRSAGSVTQSLEAISSEELHREGIREIVVATEEQRGLPMQALLQYKLFGIRITDYLTFRERECGSIDLSALQPSWMVYSEGCRQGVWGTSIKRAFDILVSITLLVFAAPLMVMVALIMTLESRGPIFYAQERVGLGGRIFTLLKFRSMRTDAEAAAAPQWASKRDPRITRVGALLRPMRIDELPQLINVLRGDMSLIGPRPERPFFVDQLSQQIPFYEFRHVIRPGLTGWAQINAPYASSIAETRIKLSYDLYYIKNRSFFLDLQIALSTIRVVLLQEGAI